MDTSLMLNGLYGICNGYSDVTRVVTLAELKVLFGVAQRVGWCIQVEENFLGDGRIKGCMVCTTVMRMSCKES